MAIAYLFYLVSFIASIVNPFWGLVGLIFSVLIRFQDRFPAIASIKPFSLLFLGMIIGCIVNRDKLAQHEWKQDKLLIGMLAFSMFGLLIQEPGDILSETWEFFSSLAFYFFASRLVQERRQFIILFGVMSCCIVYMGYEAIQDVMANPETTVFIDRRNGRWQGLGYYANANEFGQLMITTLPFLFAALLMKNNILIKAAVVVMIGVLVFVVGKTGSRTVMVLLGMMLVLTFVLRGGGNIIKKAMVGGSVGLVLLIGLSYVPGPIQDRLSTILEAGSDKSFQGRTRAWGHGFDMVMWYPVTGVGKGQWMNYHGLMPHNSYVQIMAELGPVGIGLFIWVLVLCFKEFAPFLTESDPDPPDKQRASVMPNEGNGFAPEKSGETASGNLEVHPVWGTPTGAVVSESNEAEKASIAVDPETKTVVIAVAVVFVGWLVYIFLGNQGYAVWTYFYIGLCCAVRNLDKNVAIKQDKKGVFG